MLFCCSILHLHVLIWSDLWYVKWKKNEVQNIVCYLMCKKGRKVTICIRICWCRKDGSKVGHWGGKGRREIFRLYTGLCFSAFWILWLFSYFLTNHFSKTYTIFKYNVGSLGFFLSSSFNMLKNKYWNKMWTVKLWVCIYLHVLYMLEWSSKTVCVLQAGDPWHAEYTVL